MRRAAPGSGGGSGSASSASRGVGRRVEQHLEELRAGHAVDHAVVDHLEERACARRRGPRRGASPRAGAPVEAARQEARRRLLQLARAARRRQRPAEEMVAGRRSPGRPPSSDARAERAPAPRAARSGGGAGGAPRCARPSLGAGEGALEDAEAADVERRVRALQVEEARVAARHPRIGTPDAYGRHAQTQKQTTCPRWPIRARASRPPCPISGQRAARLPAPTAACR